LADELKTLIERLKPTTFVYNFRDETPTRIDRFLDVGATLRLVDSYEILTFWFRWDHDWEGDGIEDWEPVTKYYSWRCSGNGYLVIGYPLNTQNPEATCE
jgi:hypothetical protein